MKVEVSREDNGIGVRVPSRGMWKETLTLNEAQALGEQLARITGDLWYEVWLEMVQAEINEILPLFLNDFPRSSYRDAFDAGEGPLEVAKNTIEVNLGRFTPLQE